MNFGKIFGIFDKKPVNLKKTEISDTDKFVDKPPVFSRQMSKPEVLRNMQNLVTPDSDVWNRDGRVHILNEEMPSYDYSFRDILDELRVVSFQDMVVQKTRELKRPIRIMDLFGGAYFLNHLDGVEDIVGVRLKNIDNDLREGMKDAIKEYPKNPLLKPEADYLDELARSPKRSIIEGDLYKNQTWKNIEKYDQEKGGHGFDIVVCRPLGPFFNVGENLESIRDVGDSGVNREEIFVMFLERTLSLLSKEKGILFTEIPALDTPRDIWDKFWEEYQAKKEAEGYQFFFGLNKTHPGRDAFAVRRTR